MEYSYDHKQINRLHPFLPCLWCGSGQPGMWQDIVKAKYLRNKTIASVKSRASDSPFWKNLLKVKDIYFLGRKPVLKNGNIVRFWKDAWLDNCSLMVSYPMLFDICHAQDWTFGMARENGFVLPFRRRFTATLNEVWGFIVDKARNIQFLPDSDYVTWSLNSKGVFTTKSLYQHLERNISGSHNKWIWKAKIPLKIKIFLWQLFQDVVLTRENMKKRKWLGNPTCSFCDQLETSRHLLFSCSHAKVVWGVLGSMFGASCCPSSLWQSFAWFQAFFHRNKNFHMLLLAAGCWAIWTLVLSRWGWNYRESTRLPLLKCVFYVESTS